MILLLFSKTAKTVMSRVVCKMPMGILGGDGHLGKL